jgi:hypothetical protein
MGYKYHIQVKDSRGEWSYIAGFDTFMDFLQSLYEDCEFREMDDV